MDEWKEKITDIQATLDRMASALQKLTELQIKQEAHKEALDRAFKNQDACDAKIAKIEAALPALVIAKNMVFYGTGLLSTAVIVAMVGMVVK